MIKIAALFATMTALVGDRFQDRKDRGATAVEYGLLVGLIAVVIIAVVATLGGELKEMFQGVSDKLSEVEAG